MAQKLDVSKTNADQKRLILKYAADVRKFEIERFWQRSFFFWGFISAAFIAYAQLYDNDKDLFPTLLVACFGVVCSFAWTLQNRGGKYWQEAWEQKVESAEGDVLAAPLFANDELLQPRSWGARWWGASRFSVSKLAIALSDFTVLVWIGLMGRVLTKLLRFSMPCASNYLALIAIIITTVYVVLLFFWGRSTPRNLTAG